MKTSYLQQQRSPKWNSLVYDSSRERRNVILRRFCHRWHLLSEYDRWHAGMIAQFIVEEKLRKELRDRLFASLDTEQPNLLFAHSLPCSELLRSR